MKRNVMKFAAPMIAGALVCGVASPSFADEAGFHDFMLGGSAPAAQAAPADAATPTPDQPAPVRHRHYAHAKVTHYAANKMIPHHLHARFKEKNEKPSSSS